MNAAIDKAAAVHRAFKAQPFFVQRVLLTILSTAIWMFGAFLLARHLESIGGLISIVGIVGVFWATGLYTLWRPFLVVLMVLLTFLSLD
ncbi:MULTISPECIES: hypothetical protein [Burkholderia]|uniref:hypothetical protein n=1 Tax=Burkholderia TaxID=32008 RepID=UPI000F53B8C8|nr:MULTISPECIES: hypothetical protein [Burkholderia]MCA8291758.1 hypothetical protein [Burkholderia vietnamiensis]RQM59662.1 hypothetical protein EHZ18_09005 [Burkholderia vietnamiensis]